MDKGPLPVHRNRRHFRLVWQLILLHMVPIIDFLLVTILQPMESTGCSHKPTIWPSPNMSNITGEGALNATGDWSGMLSDADEYMKEKMSKWERIGSIYNTMHMANYAIAAALGCFSIVVMATIRESKLREKPIMWYLYHMIGLTLVLIFLHTLAIFGELQNNEGTCLFVIYGLEYLFLGFAVNVILANTEIFFTVVLPLAAWRTKHFLRFMVTTLSGWIVVSLIVAHLIIDNNDARRDGSKCYYTRSKTIQYIRFALRDVVPACIGFLYTCVSIAVYVLKRYRSIQMNSAEMLKEIGFGDEKDEVNWIRSAACFNSLFVCRVMAWGILKNSHLSSDIGNSIYGIVVLISIHVQTLNLLPVAMLCIPEVRQDMKRMCMSILRFITRGRIGSADDGETLAVSFGNINATENA